MTMDEVHAVLAAQGRYREYKVRVHEKNSHLASNAYLTNVEVSDKGRLIGWNRQHKLQVIPPDDIETLIAL